MALVSGEVTQDSQASEWGYVITHEDGTILSDSGFVFDSRQEAESELVELLRRLGKQAQLP